jgi:hypothetical protein
MAMAAMRLDRHHHDMAVAHARPGRRFPLGTHGGLMIDGRGEDNFTIAPRARKRFQGSATL